MRSNKLHETETTADETPALTTNVVDFSSTLRELRQSVDPLMVRQRAAHRDNLGNTRMVDYVEWHTVADILDEHAANWEHTVKDIRQIGDIVAVTVAITIDGVTREGIGTGRSGSETGIKKAEHDALKRAAVKFGVARELYKREFETLEPVDAFAPAEPTDARPVSDPIARSLGDMVTAKQLGMIRAISREGGLDAAAECFAKFGCTVDELSKRAASEMIDHLQGLQRGSQAAAMPMRRAG
ncbi:MAG: hypothetical protein K1X36_07030 [Pyrinomonadaceae bacterium]|nr:hypothetical protein [Pyrinomonadaceae bacterium]